MTQNLQNLPVSELMKGVVNILTAIAAFFAVVFINDLRGDMSDMDKKLDAVIIQSVKTQASVEELQKDLTDLEDEVQDLKKADGN